MLTLLRAGKATTGFTGLLDTYSGAAAAYSLRRLSSSYTGPLIRVRRSSDNTELDIGYTATGDLDTTALLAFTGANSGFVTTWYDQSGNSRNATQATSTAQPRIVNAGVVDTRSSKTAMLFDGTSDYFVIGSGGGIMRNKEYGAAFAVAGWRASPTSNNVLFNITTSSLSIARFLMGGGLVSGKLFSGGRRLDANSFQSVSSSASVSTTNLQLFSSLFQYATSDLYQYINGSLDGSTTSFQTDGATSDTDSNTPTIGASLGGSPTSFLSGWMSELVIWNVNQSSSRTLIETNQNTYWSIY